MKVEEIEKWLDTEARKFDYSPILPLALMRDLLSRIRELEEGIKQLKQDLSSCNVVINHYSICQILEKLLEDK